MKDALIAQVLAEVERDFLVEIPRSEMQKCYSGAQKCEKYLIFFKKRIKFFANYRNLPSSCDKIDIEEFITGHIFPAHSRCSFLNLFPRTVGTVRE